MLPGARITAARSAQWATMDLMAGITGGRVTRNSNDPVEGMTRATNDQRGAYTLAFYSGEPDGQWHPVQVKLSVSSTPAPSRTVMVTEYGLAAAAVKSIVPLMTPVAELMLTPAGRPVAS